MPRTVVMSNPLPLGGLELAILGNPGPKRSKASTRRDATMKKSPTKAGRAKRARRRAPVTARAAPPSAAKAGRRRRRRPHLDIIPVSPKAATVRINPRRVRRNPLAFASPEGIAANPAPLAVGVMAVPTGIMVAKIVGRITRKIPGMIDAAGKPTMIGRIVTGISAAAAPVALGVVLRKKEPAMSTALMVGGAAAGLWSAWKEAPGLRAVASRPAIAPGPRLAGLDGTPEVSAAAKEAAAKEAELRQRLAAATTPDEARAIASEATAAADRAAAVNGLEAGDDDPDMAGLADDDQDVAGLLADAGDESLEIAGDEDDMAGLSGIVRRLPARRPTETKFAFANINT
jgi:hypothetical protein